MQAKVSIWQERDRVHIRLFDGDENNTIADWCDDEVEEMLEVGFFNAKNIERSVLEYAAEVGLI